MADEYKGLYVTFDGDATKLTAALHEISSESKKAQRELRDTNKALKFDPHSTQLLGAAVDATRSKVESAASRVKVLKDAQEQLSDASSKGAAKLREMEKAGRTSEDAYKMLSEEVEASKGQLKSLNDQLARAEAYLKRDQTALVNAMTAANKFVQAGEGIKQWGANAESAGKKIAGIGDSLTTMVTVPLVAAGAASVKAASDVDTALTNVKKTTDMSAAGYEKLRQSALNLSTTQPVTAESILNIEAMGAQLGWSNKNLQSFAKTVSGLDIATDMDADTAATNLAQFANITKMAQGDANRYGSAIVGLGNNMATTESKISDMAMSMASAGTQAGMSQADILGIAAATASLGMESQAGGTAFSKTITQIGTQVSTNGKQLEAWAKVAGMSVDQFKQAWSKDATSTFEAVVQGLGKAKASGQDLNVVLSSLGITETRQSDFLRRLAGNSNLVTRAVSMSNDEWSKNSALTNEVANRNQSIASKLQVLKNRAHAVAAEVGGPLVDAASSALSAAKPLITGIEGAAKAFSKMDKGSQQAIIQAIAFAAALGPVLSVTGRVTSEVGGVAKGVGSAVKVFGEFSTGLHAAAGAEATAAASAGSLATKLGAITAAHPVVAGTLAIAAGVGLVAKAEYDAEQKAQHFDTAVSTMAESAQGVSGKLSAGSQAVKDYGGKSHDSAMSVDELTKAIENHNQKQASTVSEAQTSIAMLGQYKKVIDECAGAGSVSASKQAQLEWALKGVNDACGTAYTSEQVLSGEYRNQQGEIKNTVAEIDKLIQKRQEEIRLKATQKGYSEAVENEIKMKHNLADAQQDFNEKVKEYVKDGYSAADATQMAYAWEAQNGNQLQKAKKSYKDASKEVESWAQEMAVASASCSEAGKKAEEFVKTTDGFSAATKKAGVDTQTMAGVIASSGVSLDTLKGIGSSAFQELMVSCDGSTSAMISSLKKLQKDSDALSGVGIKMSDFSAALEGAGLKASDVANISAADFARMAQSCGGNISLLIADIAAYNGVPINPKNGSVNVNDLSLTDAQGHVYTWNGSQLVTKNGTAAVNDAKLIDAQGHVWVWNGTQLVPKNASAKVDGNASNGKAKKEVDKTKKSVDGMKGKGVKAKVGGNAVDGSAKKSIKGTQKAIDDLSGKTVTVTVKTVHKDDGKGSNARGGIVMHATGGIVANGVSKHAQGAVYTAPTMIDGYNEIGEAGPEYYDGRHIVPLSSRYGSDFAQLIAQSFADLQGDQKAGIDGQMVVRWLAQNLGPTIKDNAPTMSARELRRLV